VRQEVFDFSPPVVALSSLDARKPKPAIRKKLGRAALNILGRLQEGPASWRDLQAVGGRRFSARLHEIRDAGHVIIGPEPLPERGQLETTVRNPGGDDMYELRQGH
jgi:hypothetical protein